MQIFLDNDFEDDGAEYERGTGAMTSASDTSSTRESPDLSLARYSPSPTADKGFLTPPLLRSSTDEDSQNSSFGSKFASDYVAMATAVETRDRRVGEKYDENFS